MSIDHSEAPRAELSWATRRHGSIVVATLNRFPVRNALNLASWEQLDQILAEADGDDEVRAVIITGGDKVFSAGGDMKNVEGKGAGLMKDAARLRYLQTVLARLANLSVPTIAAVEGPAVGVAWGLALACDYVVAGETAIFMAPFAERRLVPDGATAWHLVRAMGRLGATAFLLGNRTLSAAEAHGYGLVSEVVPAGNALTRSLAIAEGLAATSRDTTALTLRLLRRAEHSGYRDFLDAELELAALNLHNPEVAAARLSFKKPPTAAGERSKGER